MAIEAKSGAFAHHYRKYADKGLSVIPVIGKTPMVKDWASFCNNAPTSAQLKTWAMRFPTAGIGLCCGPASGVVSLDVDLDLKSPADGDIYSAIQSLMPKSPVLKVGAKGYTAFFQFNEERSRSIKLGGDPVLELLSTGRQTVLPPSPHPDTGRTYRWFRGDILDDRESLPILPDGTVEKIAEIISRFKRAGIRLHRSSAGVSGRNNALKAQATAAIIKGKGDEQIADELLRFDREHHKPTPLFEDDADPLMGGRPPKDNALRFVASIRRSIEGDDPASSEPERDHPGDNEESEMSLTDLLKTPDEPQSFVVDGLLPTSGTSILGGKPKIGKTTWCRVLALAVARGEPFLGRPTLKGSVLYLAMEEKKDEVKSHFRDLGATSADAEAIFVKMEPARKNPVADLRQMIERRKPTLVIVDTLIKIFRGVDINDYVKVEEAFDPILRLARSNGCHILLVHHNNKSGRDGGAALLGSTMLHGAIDTLVSLSEEGGKRFITSSQRYKGRGTDELERTALKFNKETRSISLGLTRAEDREEADKERILEVVEMNPGLTEGDIISMAKIKTATGKRLIKDLRTRSKVKATGMGKKADPLRYSIVHPATH